MKTFSLIWLVALAAPVVCSCQKAEGPTMVEGQVTELQTGKPVPYAWVSVYAQSGSGLHSGYGNAVEPRQADAAGRFHFSFEATEGTHYLLKATSDAGHSSHWGEEPDLENGRKNKNLLIPVAAPAWVKIRLEGSSGAQPDGVQVWGPWYDQNGISTLDLRPADFKKISYHMVDSSLPNKSVKWTTLAGGRYSAVSLLPFTTQPFDTVEVVVPY